MEILLWKLELDIKTDLYLGKLYNLGEGQWYQWFHRGVLLQQI